MLLKKFGLTEDEQKVKDLSVDELKHNGNVLNSEVAGTILEVDLKDPILPGKKGVFELAIRLVTNVLWISPPRPLLCIHQRHPVRYGKRSSRRKRSSRMLVLLRDTGMAPGL